MKNVRKGEYKKLFIDDDAEKYARRRRCHCLREDGPMFGLVPAEEAELARLNTEFPEDLSEEYPAKLKDQAAAEGYRRLTPEEKKLADAGDPEATAKAIDHAEAWLKEQGRP